MAKSNWDKISKMGPTDTIKNRDVFADQQLDRSKMDDKQSPFSRIVLAIVMSLLIGVFAYFIACIFQFGMHSMQMLSSGNTDTTMSSASSSAGGDTAGGERETLHYEEILTENGLRYVTDDGVEHVNIPYADSTDDPNSNSFVKDTLNGINSTGSEPDDCVELVDTPYAESTASATQSDSQSSSSFAPYLVPNIWKVGFAFVVALAAFALLYQFLMRNLDAQNAMNDTADVNQYQNDQHIALPEEVQRKFDWFPDVGAHSNIQVSSMISHVMLLNKGINPVQLSKRYTDDIVDEDGDIVAYKGEVIYDDDGNVVSDTVPFIDDDFATALFEASGAPKEVRKFYDARKIPYNGDGKDRTKQGGKWPTVADMINNDWVFPDYEPQRPAGAYLVDTEPVNTMVLAITRAGKGQTVIEPTIDMWTRELRPNNMVINDPKGELLVKNYVRGTVRGFQIVQFNLINAMKTDIYNPLGMAAEAAREGDFTKCAMYVENIADVFFPLDGGDDPVWPNAANNAFKRASYGLIDFYLEEEKELRLTAERTNMPAKILETKIDEMWGKVTLYNCYQLFVQLTSKKQKNPAVEFAKKAKAGEYDSLTDDEYAEKLAEVENQSKLWEDKPECDLLTLYFAATDALPRNQMRTLVANANNALKAMAGAEKMMAS